jgi:hypothetical protein
VWCALFVLVLCLVPNVTCVSGLFILASAVFSNVYIQNKNGGKTRNTVHEFLFSLISNWIQMKSVPDLDKERPLCYSIYEAPPNSPPSRLEEDGSVFNQFQ